MTTEALEDLAEHIHESLDGAVLAHEVTENALRFTGKCADIVEIMEFLRNDRECDFTTLIDICGVDYPDRGVERFEIVYQLLSTSQNNRVCVKIQVSEEDQVPSVVNVYSTAGWLEREVWDMYGVFFKGNPDLRRILTDYGFEGHPLRKDFPLTGYVEVRYDEELRRVVYEPVQLTQDFRCFDYLSPWEGMTDVQLPGDEKGTVPAHGWVDSRKDTQTS